MSELSYLEKLLDGAEVEWRALSEVATYVRGLTYSKSNESADGQGLRVLRANNITLSGNHLNFNDIKVVRFDTKVKDSQKLYKYDILISAASGSREHVGKVAYIESDIDYYFGGFMGVVRCNGKLNARYLFHVLTSGMFQKYLDEMLNSSTINNLSSAVMGGFNIPIPCPNNPEKSLAIQSEIVRILDKFTALTAELTAELTERKKQYNYYRDQLLSFEDGEVEWVVLGNLVDINTGSKPPEIYEKATDYDYINAGTSRSGYSDESNCEGDTVTTPSRGQGGIGYVGYQKKPFWLGPLCYKFRAIDEELLVNKYLFYFLQSRNELLLSLKKEGGVPAINKSDLVRLEVPVPPLVKQQKIVDVLDNFYTLITSITEGLPREIELRQKQYEYYRDLLFSFPKPDSVTN
ncbi:restriction endonuclease subunit S [Salmonella enterica subsp. enterica serovar Typhimurium]|uniref:restriction endonuclease subunit S n=1 Tax=Klebsiella variicola TaxID=244366 RepID=UPI0012BF14E0|nr:restriction endonuclease subunit S [Klebsiella variicola]EBV3125751.1 restriction endonuclease subunit S [Salmonella enterica subsp. enterica serovar Typhimurium]EBW5280575.1 restriction endonuclease subunit S [Salmonella enterica subsp. enterica serovar Typhimurium]EEN7779199.1 restriction endonuclease subunit S [Salmonella enterica subsp. enterica serovar Typhimurium]EFN6543441.1 restriction endonuclease subunit S [Salmonella enterica subsp. enterica serovar Typhimurium]MDI0468576.1 restr